MNKTATEDTAKKIVAQLRELFGWDGDVDVVSEVAKLRAYDAPVLVTLQSGLTANGWRASVSFSPVA